MYSFLCEQYVYICVCVRACGRACVLFYLFGDEKNSMQCLVVRNTSVKYNYGKVYVMSICHHGLD